MIKFIKLIFLILISPNCISQNFTNKILLEFLYEQGDLLSTTEDQLDIVYAIDVIKLNQLKDNAVGVFRIGAVASHAKTYFLLKEKNKFTFFDQKNIENDLISFIQLLRDMKCYSSKEKLKVIENFILTYKKNINLNPWIDRK